MAAVLPLGLNGNPSASMRCMMTASLRASATLALRMPARFAIRIAQLLSAVQFLTGLVSMMCEAWYSASRTDASPTLVMRPLTSVSPD
jgi:hypothetical protein